MDAMLKFLPIALLLCFWGLGCKSVQPGDLTGTWVMTEASRKVLPAELQNASAIIVLAGANGTFVASDMPGLSLCSFAVPSRHGAQLERGRGFWKLVSREGKQQVQLDFQEIGGWEDRLPYGTQLEVSRGSLFYFCGDADQGRRVSFERK
jgi:hypothetical protein